MALPARIQSLDCRLRYYESIFRKKGISEELVDRVERFTKSLLAINRVDHVSRILFTKTSIRLRNLRVSLNLKRTEIPTPFLVKPEAPPKPVALAIEPSPAQLQLQQQALEATRQRTATLLELDSKLKGIKKQFSREGVSDELVERVKTCTKRLLEIQQIDPTTHILFARVSGRLRDLRASLKLNKIEIYSPPLVGEDGTSFFKVKRGLEPVVFAPPPKRVRRESRVEIEELVDPVPELEELPDRFPVEPAAAELLPFQTLPAPRLRTTLQHEGAYLEPGEPVERTAEQFERCLQSALVHLEPYLLKYLDLRWSCPIIETLTQPLILRVLKMAAEVAKQEERRLPHFKRQALDLRSLSGNLNELYAAAEKRGGLITLAIEPNIRIIVDARSKPFTRFARAFVFTRTANGRMGLDVVNYDQLKQLLVTHRASQCYDCFCEEGVEFVERIEPLGVDRVLLNRANRPQLPDGMAPLKIRAPLKTYFGTIDLSPYDRAEIELFLNALVSRLFKAVIPPEYPRHRSDFDFPVKDAAGEHPFGTALIDKVIGADDLHERIDESETGPFSSYRTFVEAMISKTPQNGASMIAIQNDTSRGTEILFRMVLDRRMIQEKRSDYWRFYIVDYYNGKIRLQVSSIHETHILVNDMLNKYPHATFYLKPFDLRGQGAVSVHENGVGPIGFLPPMGEFDSEEDF